jgi:hypothetical protein
VLVTVHGSHSPPSTTAPKACCGHPRTVAVGRQGAQGSCNCQEPQHAASLTTAFCHCCCTLQLLTSSQVGCATCWQIVQGIAWLIPGTGMDHRFLMGFGDALGLACVSCSCNKVLLSYIAYSPEPAIVPSLIGDMGNSISISAADGTTSTYVP